MRYDKTYSSLVTQKQNKKLVLTKLSIVEGQAGGGLARVHGEDVIAALAAEDRGVAPAPAQEQQHHQHHHGERRDRAYVRSRLHCAHKPRSTLRQRLQHDLVTNMFTISRVDDADVGHHPGSLRARGPHRCAPSSRALARTASHAPLKHSTNIFLRYNATIKRTEGNNWDVLARSGCQSGAHALYARGTTGSVEYSARL